MKLHKGIGIGLSILGATALINLFSAPLRAENIVYPANAGVINVKAAPYFAKGDGVSDDTAILQKVLDDNATPKRIIYFPNGTYLISDGLIWRGAAGKRLKLQGQSQAQTIIKLKNNATGFNDPLNRKAVLTNFDGTLNAQAFFNYLFNLTIDVGAGNSGAVGINFITNNVGGIRDVTIRSSDPNKAGARGLLLTKPYPGPGLIRNLTVDGFDQGVRVSPQDYSMVFENLTLKNQRQAGLVNQDNLLSIRGLTSVNSVPAIQNIAGSGNNWGLITLVDANLTGGSSANTAIQNTSGRLYLRNITTSGYQAALTLGSQVIPGTSVSEYASVPALRLASTAQGHLKLPILPTPDVPWDSLTDWVSVTAYGAKPNDYHDDTVAIQKAIDSGKTTVYFPQGTYNIGDTIHIRGNVRRIIGLWSIITVDDPLKSSTKPAFRFESTTQSTVMFEQIQADYLTGTINFTFMEHASPNTLVIRNSSLSGNAYRNTPGAGKLFIEDVVAAPWVFNQQQVWARQLNPEYVGTKIVNNGGNVWILGLKTEEIGTVIETNQGGRTELLGGLIYPIDNVPPTQPAFLNNESSMSISIGESAYSATSGYATFVQEIKNGVTQILTDTSVPGRSQYGRVLPLYVGY